MLRVDHERWGQRPEDLRNLAVKAPHARSRERFLALYEITQGSNATRVATRIGRHPQDVMKWVHRYNAGGPDAVSWNEFWQRLKRALGMRRPSIHVPVRLMRVNALLTERLPGNIPLTRDLLTMLEHGDNVVSNDDAVRTFELPLVPLEEQLRRAV